MAEKRKAAKRTATKKLAERKKPLSQRAMKAIAALEIGGFKINHPNAGKKGDSIYLKKGQDINAAMDAIKTAVPTAKKSGDSTILIPTASKKPAKKAAARVVTVSKKKRQRRDMLPVNIESLIDLVMDPKRTKKNTQFAVAVLQRLPSVATQRHVMRKVLNGNALPKTVKKSEKVDLSKASAKELMDALAKKLPKGRRK